MTQTNGSNSYIDKFSLVETSAITTSVTSSSTDAQVPSAKAVYDAIGEGGGGLDEDFLQANANALYELKQEGKATNERFDNYYTKTASDGRYASNASIKKTYYDKAYVDDKLLAISASLNELNDDKQDALVAGEGISISGNVISAEGGGGAEYSAGTNIEITTANTINCTLPITTSRNNPTASIKVEENIIGKAQISVSAEDIDASAIIDESMPEKGIYIVVSKNSEGYESYEQFKEAVTKDNEDKGEKEIWYHKLKPGEYTYSEEDGLKINKHLFTMDDLRLNTNYTAYVYCSYDLGNGQGVQEFQQISKGNGN